ncbi:MAG: c-type cytochrome [Gammaproteobacteria bacterium]|nr:c-type cytochrome [Gammaproteobacteria bacterium]
MKVKKIVTSLILLISGLMPIYSLSAPGQISQLLSLKPDIKNGAKIYPLCASCHMATGWGKKDGSFPVIAGQHPRVLIKQMVDIRDKNRENPTMFPFTDPDSIGGIQSLVDVTAYISTLAENPEPGTGSGKQLTLGAAVYVNHCAQCHGDKGEGNNAAFSPQLKGQHYAYLLRQIKWIRAGYRKNSDPAMVAEVGQLSAEQLDAVADYLSRL